MFIRIVEFLLNKCLYQTFSGFLSFINAFMKNYSLLLRNLDITKLLLQYAPSTEIFRVDNSLIPIINTVRVNH